MNDRIDGYAQALLSVARAEGDLDSIRSELAEVARAVVGNDELRATLGNNLLPAAVRGQIVDDILTDRTTDATRALVGMIVAAGRGGELDTIVESFVRQAAAGGGRQVAQVRSAVPLSDDQKARIVKALSARLGSDVELESVVDPEVVGGIVTTVGDTVIDGSLRSRLTQMRETL